jgi:hypothetical protein
MFRLMCRSKRARDVRRFKNCENVFLRPRSIHELMKVPGTSSSDFLFCLARRLVGSAATDYGYREERPEVLKQIMA